MLRRFGRLPWPLVVGRVGAGATSTRLTVDTTLAVTRNWPFGATHASITGGVSSIVSHLHRFAGLPPWVGEPVTWHESRGKDGWVTLDEVSTAAEHPLPQAFVVVVSHHMSAS